MQLRIHAHCRDAFCAEVIVDGQEVPLVESDYVPVGVGIGGGDAVHLTIDMETGWIVNWDSETVKAAINRIRNNEED